MQWHPTDENAAVRRLTIPGNLAEMLGAKGTVSCGATPRPCTRPTSCASGVGQAPPGCTPLAFSIAPRREYDVLRRVALSETNAEIAEATCLSRNTVKTYLQSALQKLGAQNRVEAIARASEGGLL